MGCKWTKLKQNNMDWVEKWISQFDVVDVCVLCNHATNRRMPSRVIHMWRIKDIPLKLFCIQDELSCSSVFTEIEIIEDTGGVMLGLFGKDLWKISYFSLFLSFSFCRFWILVSYRQCDGKLMWKILCLATFMLLFISSWDSTFLHNELTFRA